MARKSAKIESDNPSLLLDPENELRFRGPFTNVSTAELLLKNPSDKRICFKVKTTAPKQYCVRPNSGFIPPGHAVKIQIILQPFEYSVDETARHKFLIQSIVCSEEEENAELVWKGTAMDKVMETKIKCGFYMPDESEQVEQSVIPSPRTLHAPSPPPRIRTEPSRPADHQSSRSSIEGQTVSLNVVVIIAVAAVLIGIAIGKFVI